MKTQAVLKIIDEVGYFCFGPNEWGEYDAAIKGLYDNGIIVTIAEAGIKFINEDYFYIRKGNPLNVSVHKEGNYSFLAKRR